jgi:MoxR-like ATPase
MNREKIAKVLTALQAGLLERDDAARALLLALLAGEHVLLVGPPGTAKSQLARRLAHVVEGGIYFERLLTKFSVPEELFGPLSIKALEADRFERKTRGFMPEAHIAFIDEVFKASSAILNTLLLLLNERAFDNGDERLHTPLMTVVSASNEVPLDDTLAAFYDRFAVRAQVSTVSDEAFSALLQLRDDTHTHHHTLTHQECEALRTRAQSLPLSDEALNLMKALRTFTQANGWAVSDRRWRKLMHVMQVAAAANERDTVQVWDVLLAQYVLPATPEQAPKLVQWFAEQLGVWQAYDAPRFTNVMEAFEATLQQEMNAQDVALTDTGSGKQQFMRNDARNDEVTPDSMRLSSPLLRQRRYGQTHVSTRQAQVRELLDQLTSYKAALDERVAQVHALSTELFIAPSFAPHALAVLGSTTQTLLALQVRAQALIAGFAALPLLPSLEAASLSK